MSTEPQVREISEAEFDAYIAASESAERHPPMTVPLRDPLSDPDWQWVQSEVDPGIRHAVKLLRSYWFETIESCEGGPDHAHDEATIWFHGDEDTGPAAARLLTDHGYAVAGMQYVRLYCLSCDELEPARWKVTLPEMPAGAGDAAGR